MTKKEKKDLIELIKAELLDTNMTEECQRYNQALWAAVRIVDQSPVVKEPIPNPHEQVLQLLITGGFLNPDKLQEARDIIGSVAPGDNQSLELSQKDKEEKVKHLMGLVRYGWTCAAGEILKYCEDTKVSWDFTQKIIELLDENNKQKFVYEIFQKHIPESSRPSIDIVDELRKANPYGPIDSMPWETSGFEGWDKAADKVKELLTQQK